MKKTLLSLLVLSLSTLLIAGCTPAEPEEEVEEVVAEEEVVEEAVEEEVVEEEPVVEAVEEEVVEEEPVVEVVEEEVVEEVAE
jgi:hypothetical protein